MSFRDWFKEKPAPIPELEPLSVEDLIPEPPPATPEAPKPLAFAPKIKCAICSRHVDAWRTYGDGLVLCIECAEKRGR